MEVLGYLGQEEQKDSIANYFHCKILNGEVKLGGEELDRMIKDNYYEARYVKIKNLDNIDILGVDMIIKAINKEYTQL